MVFPRPTTTVPLSTSHSAPCFLFFITYTSTGNTQVNLFTGWSCLFFSGTKVSGRAFLWTIISNQYRLCIEGTNEYMGEWMNPQLPIVLQEPTIILLLNSAWIRLRQLLGINSCYLVKFLILLLSITTALFLFINLSAYLFSSKCIIKPLKDKISILLLFTFSFLAIHDA